MRFFVLLWGFLWMYAQTSLQLKLAQAVYLKEAKEVPFTGYLDFPYINKYRYYHNKEALAKIRKAEKEKDWETLNRLLTDYVQRFGIENFRWDKDLDLIWKLGQLREYLGDTATALFLYQLAIQNQHRYIDSVKMHYWALKAPTHNEYVDLEYYYRILEERRKIDSLMPPKAVLLRLPPHINTGYPEYAPYLHPSGGVLIFTSRREESRLVVGVHWLKNEDLYYIERDVATDSWAYPEKFTDEINSPYNEGSACLDKDAMHLIFVRCNAPDGYGQCDLYAADYVNGKWTNVRNLGPNVNSPYWDSHPSLSMDGKYLFFASNRPGGFGKTDIYYCERLPNGEWGPAKNLGPVINTAQEELTPFFHPINNTLYFASSGHIPNFGGYDIYKSRWINGRWEIPRNLGPLVNQNVDEFYFTISGKGDKIFFAKANPADPEDFDLYSFEMPMGARPDAITPLRGYLIDSVTGHPLTGIVVAIDLDKGTEIEPIYINPYGYFEFRLIANRRYELLVLGYNAVVVNNEQAQNEDTLLSLVERSILMNKPLVFETFNFERGKAEITPDIARKLRSLATLLHRFPDAELIVRGHTDATGSHKYNMKLSKQRADAVKRFLVKELGIPPERITAEGYGETRPVFPNDTEEHRRKNRRVEFIVRVSRETYQKIKEKFMEQRQQPSELAQFLFLDDNVELLTEPIRDEATLQQQLRRLRGGMDTLYDPLTAALPPDLYDPEFQLIEDIVPAEAIEEEEEDPWETEEDSLWQETSLDDLIMEEDEPYDKGFDETTLQWEDLTIDDPLTELDDELSSQLQDPETWILEEEWNLDLDIEEELFKEEK